MGISSSFHNVFYHLDLSLCAHSLRDDVHKQQKFVEAEIKTWLEHQWIDTFRFRSSTVRALIKELAPFQAATQSGFICLAVVFISFIMNLLYRNTG